MTAFWHAQETVKGGYRLLWQTNYNKAGLIIAAMEKIVVVVFKLHCNVR